MVFRSFRVTQVGYLQRFLLLRNSSIDVSFLHKHEVRVAMDTHANVQLVL